MAVELEMERRSDSFRSTIPSFNKITLSLLSSTLSFPSITLSLLNSTLNVSKYYFEFFERCSELFEELFSDCLGLRVVPWILEAPMKLCGGRGTATLQGSHSDQRRSFGGRAGWWGMLDLESGCHVVHFAM